MEKQQKMSVLLLIDSNTIYQLAIKTARILTTKQYELRNITWSDGESNPDTGFSELACTVCKDAWNKMKINNPDFTEIDITCSKPDITIVATYPDKSSTKHKIELKSSKSTKMPGSTINKLDINQAMIYCLRPHTETEAYHLKCSQYYSAMGSSNIDLFQDITPRPSINFEKMNELDNTLPFDRRDKNDWILHFANCGLKRIEKTTVCNPSWQDDMIKIMKKKIIEEYIMNTTEEQFRLDKKMSSQVENINIS